jgi:heme oxygenase
MIKKEITPYQYYVYLSNQLLCYYVLESAATNKGLLNGIEVIKRSNQISKDLTELEREHGFSIPKHLKSIDRYIDYVGSISSEPDRLMAHIYVRHMGDLSGGQILRKLVPGSGLHYQFDEDVDVLKQKIRDKLHDGMADEANRCFDMIYEFFEELEQEFNDVGSSNKAPKGD